MQRNFGYDDRVLSAVHPVQLGSVVDDLNKALANGLDGEGPTLNHIVFSVCNDVLHLPQQYGESDCSSATSQSQARFREILFAPENEVHDQLGYVGQAIPFTLTPELTTTLNPEIGDFPEDNRTCAENIFKVDIHYVGSIADALPMSLAKREQFYAQTCLPNISDIGPAQDGIHRSSHNLFVNGSASQFGQDEPWATAQVTASDDSDATGFARNATPSANAVASVAGRALFGDYRLVVPAESLLTIIDHPEQLADIKVRIDYVSVVNPADLPPTTSTRQLTIELDDGNGAVLPGNGGNSVTTDSCSSSNCPTGSIVNLTATAAAGWHFAQWGGACSGFSTTCSVTMVTARKVWASFVQDTPNVTLTVNRAGTGNGSVLIGWAGATAPSPSGSTTLIAQVSQPSGTSVTLNAVTPPDSIFSGWSGGGCSGIGACTVLLTGTPSPVTATFTHRPTLTVGVSLNGGASDPWRVGVGLTQGSAGPIACDSVSCAIPFDPGTSVALVPTLNGGPPYAVTGWQGSGCTGTSSCTVTMTADTAATVQFKSAFKVTVDRPTTANGTIVATVGGTQLVACGVNAPPPPPGSGGCSSWVIAGTSVTFSAQPQPGASTFSAWQLGASSCTTNPCTITPTADIEVAALLTPIHSGGGGGGGHCTGACGEP